MSLKLDELRKRLLQQPPSELAGPELHHAAETIVAKPRETKRTAAKSVEPRKSTSVENVAAAAAAPDPAKELQPKADGPAQPSSPEAAAPEHESSEPPRPEPEALPSAAQPSLAAQPATGQNQIAEAVAKVFEQTAAARLRFDELSRTLGELGEIGAAAGQILEPLRIFHAQLAELAESFGPMRALQAQLGRMAETFEPMRVLHDQMSQLADSIQIHLGEMIEALGPAMEFRGRVLSLARSLDNAGELQADIGALYSVFDNDHAPHANELNTGPAV